MTIASFSISLYLSLSHRQIPYNDKTLLNFLITSQIIYGKYHPFILLSSSLYFVLDIYVYVGTQLLSCCFGDTSTIFSATRLRIITENILIEISFLMSVWHRSVGSRNRNPKTPFKRIVYWAHGCVYDCILYRGWYHCQKESWLFIKSSLFLCGARNWLILTRCFLCENSHLIFIQWIK